MSGAQALLGGLGQPQGGPQNQTGGVNVGFNADGTCSISTGMLPTPTNWMSIVKQPGIGALYWLQVSKTGSTGSATTWAQNGVWQSLAAPPNLYIASGSGTVTGTLKISSQASGNPVLASGTYTTNNTI